MREKSRLIHWIILCLTVFLFCAQKKDFNYTNFIMGGPCEISFTCSNGGIASQTISEIDEELRRLDSLLSYFSPASFVSQLNKNHRAQADSDIIRLFTLSDSISRLTHGLFDISIAPLVEVWGFYDQKRSIPDRATVDSARLKVDYRRIRIRGDSVFIPENMRVDLGGIAQGYAADRVGEIFKKYEISSAIINIGGEILAIGDSPAGRPWIIGIKNPRGDGVIETVRLKDEALSTSGDYEKFYVVDGIRYPHIIDSRSGYPARRFASVTILAKTAGFADGIATAVAIMGPDRGLRFIDSLGIKGIIYHEENRRLQRVTNQ